MHTLAPHLLLDICEVEGCALLHRVLAHLGLVVRALPVALLLLAIVFAKVVEDVFIPLNSRFEGLLIEDQ